MTFAFREIVAGFLILLFTYALARNPHDQTIIGALLTGFAGAWGFYLGGSKIGSDTAEKNANTVADNAKAAMATGGDDATGKPGDPVHTVEEGKE